MQAGSATPPSPGSIQTGIDDTGGDSQAHHLAEETLSEGWGSHIDGWGEGVTDSPLGSGRVSPPSSFGSDFNEEDEEGSVRWGGDEGGCGDILFGDEFAHMFAGDSNDEDDDEEGDEGSNWWTDPAIRGQYVIPSSGVTVLQFSLQVAKLAVSCSKRPLSAMLKLMASVTPKPHSIPPSWHCVRAVLGIPDVAKTERHACPSCNRPWLGYLPKSQWSRHEGDRCESCNGARFTRDRLNNLVPSKKFWYLGLGGVEQDISSEAFHDSRKTAKSPPGEEGGEGGDFWASPLAQHLSDTTLPGLTQPDSEWVAYVLGYDGAQVYLSGSGGQVSHTSGFVFIHSLDWGVQKRFELRNTHCVAILPGPTEEKDVVPFLQELLQDFRKARESGLPGPGGAMYKPAIVHIDGDLPAGTKLMDLRWYSSKLCCARCLMMGTNHASFCAKGSNHRIIHVGYYRQGKSLRADGTELKSLAKDAPRILGDYVPDGLPRAGGTRGGHVRLRHAKLDDYEKLPYKCFPRLVRWPGMETAPHVDAVYGYRVPYFHSFVMGLGKDLFKKVFLANLPDKEPCPWYLIPKASRAIMLERAQECVAPPGGCPSYRSIVAKDLKKVMSGWKGAEVAAWFQTFGPVVLRGLLNTKQEKLWRHLREAFLRLFFVPSEEDRAS